jgi:hypothetical protein
MYNSRGLPLDIVFEFLRQKDSIPCWVSFYEDARGCGWPDRKILTTVEQTLRDSGDESTFVDGVMLQLRAYIQHLGRKAL